MLEVLQGLLDEIPDRLLVLREVRVYLDDDVGAVEVLVPVLAKRLEQHRPEIRQWQRGDFGVGRRHADPRKRLVVRLRLSAEERHQRPLLTSRDTLPLFGVVPAFGDCQMTSPLATVLERPSFTDPLVQWAFVIAVSAAASALRTTFGTMHATVAAGGGVEGAAVVVVVFVVVDGGAEGVAVVVVAFVVVAAVVVVVVAFVVVAGSEKLAVAEWSPLIASVHWTFVPEQSPAQWSKVEPAAALAVSVSDVPFA